MPNLINISYCKQKNKKLGGKTDGHRYEIIKSYENMQNYNNVSQ